MIQRKTLPFIFGLFFIGNILFAQSDSMEVFSIPAPPIVPHYENLVFEGGGIRGVVYCGALMELDSRGLLKDVRRVAGTSSGAITACLLSVGYTPTEMADIIGGMNFGKLNDGGGLFVGGLLRLKRRMGYYRGEKFLRWIEQLVANKTGNKDLTFLELKKLAEKDSTYRELVVTATCMNHQKAEYFDFYRYPNMRIVDAVRASMAVPLYFEPFVMDDAGHRVDVRHYADSNHICLDGGFLSNYPIWVFDQAPYICSPYYTLGFRIDSEYQIEVDRTKTKTDPYYPIHGTKDLVGSTYYIMKENLNRFMLTELDWERTVSISDAGIGPKVKKLSTEQKELFLYEGKRGVTRYFQGYP
jgi:NTE family protein